jgi:hypothetical protein
MNNLPIIKDKYPVYVISLTQPFLNWFGTLESYYPSENFCEVLDNSDKIHRVRISEVYCSETNKNIREIL